MDTSPLSWSLHLSTSAFLQLIFPSPARTAEIKRPSSSTHITNSATCCTVQCTAARALHSAAHAPQPSSRR